MGQRLKSRVAIVTGGASGIGAAIAETFLKQGAAVVIGDFDLPKATRLSESFSHLGQVAATKVDVSDGDSYRELVAFAERRFGSFDIVVNCAGVSQVHQPAQKTEEQEYDTIFDVNMKALFWCAKHAIPRLLEKGSGVVINICSVSASRPRKGNAWYTASKAAAAVATKSLALECADRNVRVCGISPGAVETPLLLRALGEGEEQQIALQQMRDTIPLGRTAKTQEIANGVLFLASDEASFVTGVVLGIDGGRSI